MFCEHIQQFRYVTAVFALIHLRVLTSENPSPTLVRFLQISFHSVYSQSSSAQQILGLTQAGFTLHHTNFFCIDLAYHLLLEIFQSRQQRHNALGEHFARLHVFAPNFCSPLSDQAMFMHLLCLLQLTWYILILTVQRCKTAVGLACKLLGSL